MEYDCENCIRLQQNKLSKDSNISATKNESIFNWRGDMNFTKNVLVLQ